MSEYRERGERGVFDAIGPLHDWIVDKVCCGRDDGSESFMTWGEAQNFREAYTSGVAVNPRGYSAHDSEPGHKRAAIVRSASRPKAEASS